MIPTAFVCRACALAVPVALAGCMTTPNHGDTQSSTATPRSFAGFYPGPSVTIHMESSTAEVGPFSEFATAVTSARSIQINGTPLHAWSVTAAVPSWTMTACGNHETFVRARYVGPSAAFRLYHFDAANVSDTGEEGVDCLLEALGDGANVSNATLDCASDAAAVRLLAGDATHVGDVVISSQAEADALACYTHIEGNLTLADDSSELALALPYLREVSGDVTVVYSRSVSNPPDVRDIRLPSLTHVGGSLDLSYPGNSGDIVSVQLGLDNLTSLGGDLTIFADGFNTALYGLDQLAHVPGDLHLEQDGSDFTLWGLLDNLTSVGGDVFVSSSHTTLGTLSALASVGGDVEVTGVYFPPGAENFDALQSVGGNLHASSLNLVADNGLDPQFPSLTNVSGILEISQAADFAALAALGDTASGLSVGGLVLDDNGHLDDLSATHVSVALPGPITLTNNASLPTAQADAFVAAQAMSGWAGTATVSGNAP